jgi:hypothetical protein
MRHTKPDNTMKQDWNYIEELGRISTGTGIVIEATGGEKSECQDALQLAALAPAMLESIKSLYSSLAWHVDNHGHFGMDMARLEEALGIIFKASKP